MIKFINEYMEEEKAKNKSVIIKCFSWQLSISFIKAVEKGDYFDDRKVSVSTYKRNGARGFSFSIFEYAIFILLKNQKKVIYK